jgi:hypothetical protein
MANTGNKVVLTLRKYVNGVPTNTIKNNNIGDPDYIAPYEDLTSCPFGDPSPETPTTTMSHFFVDSDGQISNYSNSTTTYEGSTGTYNFTISAPTGFYWTSAPTFTSNVIGCTATASINADNTLLDVQMNYTQGGSSSSATYTYSSLASLSEIVVNSIEWDNGTSVNVSSSGASPVTYSINGFVTVSGDDKTIRPYVANNTNYDNIASVDLTVNGNTSTATTGGVFGTYYGSPMTLAAGTYPYTITITLSLVTGNTMGAASGNVQNVI